MPSGVIEETAYPLLPSWRQSQWPQLGVLTFIHFGIDSYMGMIPALMPGIISYFGISVHQSVTIMIVASFLVNLTQLLVGHTRSGKKMPLMIYVGGILTMCGGALSLVPANESAFLWLLIFFSLSAVGVGLVHPESFRAVHGLARLKPEVSTAAFMIGGQLGYGIGAWLGAALVVWLGFSGLWLLAIVIVIMLVLTAVMRIELADDNNSYEDNIVTEKKQLSIWPIWLLAIPAAYTMTVFLNMLPQKLSELGYPLDFGGYCHWLFMGGSVFGLIAWSWLTRYVNTIACIGWSFAIGTPLLGLYIRYIQIESAAWLLALAGFCLMAPFTLLVKEARFAGGLNLGGRMALTTGGTWFMSNIAFLVTSFLFKSYSTEEALIDFAINYSWLACLISTAGGFGLYFYCRSKQVATSSDLHGG